jgi:hypothetical protein
MRRFVLILIVAACPAPTPPKTYTVDKNFTISAPVDATWSAIVDVFALRNWKIDKLDKASGLITTDWMLVSAYSTETVGQFMDCGTTPGETEADKLRSLVSFNIVVHEAGPNTAVTVNASFRRRLGNGLIDCESTGAVEDLIHENLRTKTKGAAVAKDGRRTVEGDKPLLCAPSASEVGLCFLDAVACKAEADKVGVAQCEERSAGSCFTATRTLDETKTTTCAVSIKDCEARRETLSKDPDFTVTACGIYRAARK